MTQEGTRRPQEGRTYQKSGSWWRRMDSNQRPSAYEAPALPLSYVATGRTHRPAAGCCPDIYTKRGKVGLSISRGRPSGQSHEPKRALAVVPAKAGTSVRNVLGSCLRRNDGNMTVRLMRLPWPPFLRQGLWILKVGRYGSEPGGLPLRQGWLCWRRQPL